MITMASLEFTHSVVPTSILVSGASSPARDSSAIDPTIHPLLS
jgi:hypothetical protein